MSRKIPREKLVKDLQGFVRWKGRMPKRLDGYVLKYSRTTYVVRLGGGSWAEVQRRLGLSVRGKGGTLDNADDVGYTYGPNFYGKNGQRQKTLDRDGRECRVCGMTMTEHLDEHGEELHVHHVKPARYFRGDDYECGFDYEVGNKLSNLVTLCVDCHNEYGGQWTDFDAEGFTLLAQMDREMTVEEQSSPSQPTVAD